MKTHKLKIQADLNEVSDVYHFVETLALKENVDEGTIYDLKLAIEETLTNIIVHGYQKQPGEIDVEVRLSSQTFTITIWDTAPLFDLTKSPEPDINQPIYARDPGGFGIFLALQAMDEVTHSARAGGGNKIILTKHFK